MKELVWLCLGTGLLLAGAAACSGDEVDSGGPSNSTGSGGTGGATAGSGGTAGADKSACKEACERVSAANCPNADDQYTCRSKCESGIANLTECGGQWVTRLKCVAANGEVTCEEDGKALVTGCDQSIQAYLDCLDYCEPLKDDSPCAACRKPICCTAYRNFASDLEYADYQDCLATCSDASCRDDCAANYASAASRSEAFETCLATSCVAECAETTSSSVRTRSHGRLYRECA